MESIYTLNSFIDRTANITGISPVIRTAAEIKATMTQEAYARYKAENFTVFDELKSSILRT